MHYKIYQYWDIFEKQYYDTLPGEVPVTIAEIINELKKRGAYGWRI